jgi:hypothetical protein
MDHDGHGQVVLVPRGEHQPAEVLDGVARDADDDEPGELLRDVQRPDRGC